VIKYVAPAVDGSLTVSLAEHRFYDHHYDVELRPVRSARLRLLRRLIAGPWLLGRLASRARGFLYLGATGFLLDTVDSRQTEFAFLSRRGIRIACCFVGDDIRAPRLMHEMERRTGRPNVSSRVSELSPEFETDRYDDLKREVARVADEFSDLIFNSPTDQLSYLRRPTHRVPFLFPDVLFESTTDKFSDVTRPLVVHAPTAPAIKGTDRVRAAVQQLRDEGYDFEYLQLEGVRNDEVLRTLRRAHIVLNQFYASMPGQLGFESLASRCVLLQSADETVERTLPAGANEAWLVTGPEEIADHLRGLLDEPSRWRDQAERGWEWAWRHYSMSQAGPALNAILVAALETPSRPERP